jgi:KRAB domain-containing zinc finger protein
MLAISLMIFNILNSNQTPSTSKSNNFSNPPTFKCEKCQTNFENYKELELHRHWHSLEDKFTCEICNRKFDCVNSFDSHQKNFHNVTVNYKCDKCNCNFNSNWKLSMHLWNHTKMVNCVTCSMTFENDEQLKKHAIVHTLPPTTQSTAFEFEQQEGFVIVSTQKRNHEFSLMNTETEKRIKISNSQSSSEPKDIIEKLYSCVICRKKFKSKANLELHILIHSTNNKFECSYCLKKFDKFQDLSKHQIDCIQ